MVNKLPRPWWTSDTKVDVDTGMDRGGTAAVADRFHGLERGTDLLVMKVQLAQICDAVKSTVPQEMWAAIIEKLEELEQHSEALDVGKDSFDDADDDPYDPTEFITTTTTSFDLRSARRHRGRWGPLPVWTGRSQGRVDTHVWPAAPS